MPYGDLLFQRLRLAERPDLLDLLRDLKLDPVRFTDATNEDLVTTISAELRAAAGNSFVNIVRDRHDFQYKQILIDVADKLAPGRFSWTDFKLGGPETEGNIERYIHGRVEAMMREHLKTMTEAGKAELQERVQADCKARGISSAAIQGSLTGLGTAAMVGAATGPLLAGVMFSTILSSLIAVPVRHVVLAGVAGGGPVGLLVGLAVAVAGTSYSKTIPAVIRLITIKLSHDQKVAMGAGSR